MFAYTMTPTSINMFINGRMRTIDSTHANYTKIDELLKDLRWGDEPAILSAVSELIDIPAYIAHASHGKIVVTDDKVLYAGTELHGVLVERLLAALHGGYPISSLLHFADRVMRNPVESAREELYIWLENSKLPLTADGCFLAFKKVRDDYRSYYDHATRNDIGTTLPPMDDVDTDRARTCSRGYHFCSYDYLPHYFGNQGRVVILKVAPEDVRAIPNDYDNAKGRARTYEVIGEVPEEDAAKVFAATPVLSSFGTYTGSFDDENDEYDGDDDDYDDDGDDDADDKVFADSPLNWVWTGGTDTTADSTPVTSRAVPVIPSSYTYRGKTYSREWLRTFVDIVGQRATARALDIPRSTLQGWLAKG